MKWLIWTIGGVLALLWTGALALAALIVDRTGEALQQAGAAGGPSPALPTDMPSAFAGWLDPAAWASLVQGFETALSWVQSLLPAIGTATGWLEPLVWMLWAVGVIALLALTAGSHWLVAGRTARHETV